MLLLRETVAMTTKTDTLSQKATPGLVNVRWLANQATMESTHMSITGYMTVGKSFFLSPPHFLC